MKVCKRCKEEKPLINFYNKGKYFFSDCIDCEQDKRKLAPRKERALKKQKTAESKYKRYLYFEKNFDQLKRIIKLIKIINKL